VDDGALCGLRHGSPVVRRWKFARQRLRPHYISMTDSAIPDIAPLPPLDQFPILDKGLYFNHAAVGPWPRCTAEAVQHFAAENMNQGSAAYRQWFSRENDLRKNLALLTGAGSADDIALLKNTTEGICTVAFGLQWRAGDNIVLPRGEFPSNRLPWLAQAARGVEIREIDVRGSPCAETAVIEAMDHNTRLLTVSAVAWDDGFRLDLAALGQACRKNDVLFFVDAIQQLGALPLDVDACRIDFLAADAHKWLLAPEGIAVFYSREEARLQLNLLQQGWHMFDQPWQFEREDWTPSASARRFEAGSPNTMGQAALHASAGLLLDYGMESVSRRILTNTDQLLRSLSDLSGIHIVSSTKNNRRSGIVTFAHERIPAHKLHAQLVQAGVSCVMRGGGIRLSPHFYQGEKQILAFMAILKDALEQPG
jgi:selenocysteine lyase/cysteine desulfurase